MKHFILLLIALTLSLNCHLVMADFKEFAEGPVKERVEKAYGGGNSPGYKQSKEDAQKLLQQLPEILKEGKEPPRAPHYGGVTDSERELRYEVDRMETLSVAWLQCQDPDNFHLPTDLADMPDIEIEEGEGNEIYIHLKYPGKLGTIHGNCFIYIGTYYGIRFYIELDIIQYYYPVAKVNVSEQPFLSRYLTKDEVNEARKEIIEWQAHLIPNNTRDLMVRATKQVQSSMPVLGRVPATGNTTGVAPDPVPTPPDVPNFEMTPVKVAREHLKSIPDHMRLTNPSNNYMEARYLAEDEEAILGNFAFMPHQPKEASLATDVFDGYLLSRLFTHSEFVDEGRHGIFTRPAGSTRCISHNKVLQKTPEDLLPGVPPSLDHTDPKIMIPLFPMLADDVCLDNVGEVFPYTNKTRLSTTDKIFQATQRITNLTDARVGMERETIFFAGLSEFHTYWRSFDKWYVLHDDGVPGFKSEVKQCSTIPEMAKKNMDFSTNLAKKAGEGAEVTFELWALFKGCWGLPGAKVGNMWAPKGLDDDFWLPPNKKKEKFKSRKIPFGLRVH